MLRNVKMLLFISISMISCMLSAQYDDTYPVTTIKGPKVLGIQLGSGPSTVGNAMQSMSIKLANRKESGANNVITIDTYDGLPTDLIVKQGITKAIFFKNQLIQLYLIPQPSYKDFLLLKTQLFNALGERFALSTKKEAMNNFLKAHLAMSKSNEDIDEKAISESIIKGETYWFYEITDKEKEMKISLSYRCEEDANGIKKPKLQLCYEWNDGIERLKEFENSLGNNILPAY